MRLRVKSGWLILTLWAALNLLLTANPADLFPKQVRDCTLTASLAAAYLVPSSLELSLTHIFGWTPGAEFEVLVSPWLPGPRIRARLQPFRRGSYFDWALSP